MSTTLDQMQARPRRGKPGASVAGDAAGVFSFMIDGRRFTAMDTRPRGERRLRGPSSSTPANGYGAIIGRISADDIQYDVFSSVAERKTDLPPIAECLTCRELQVATLIADGKCDKEIARQLGISSYTVREHLRRIFAKLKVCKRSAVISWMLRGPVRG